MKWAKLPLARKDGDKTNCPYEPWGVIIPKDTHYFREIKVVEAIETIRAHMQGFILRIILGLGISHNNNIIFVTLLRTLIPKCSSSRDHSTIIYM